MTDRRCVDQFRRFVIRPVLDYLDPLIPKSEAAENLLVGTAVHESGLQFFDQWTGPDDVTLGPALGFFEVEPETHADLYDTFLKYRPELHMRLVDLAAPNRDLERQLVTNLEYATAVARLRYWRAPDPLPASDDIAGLADYWKRFYNSAKGKGSTAEWIHHYRSFVA